MKVISKQRNSRMCVVCGMDNPNGFRAQFYNMEDGSVVTPFCYREEHQSFPQRVHGGLTATMLDELGLRAIWAKLSEDVFGVTMSMEVKYRKPVPYDVELLGRGILVKDTEILDRKGILLADAEVKYIKMKVEQIVQDVNPHEEMCYLIEDGVTEILF